MYFENVLIVLKALEKVGTRSNVVGTFAATGFELMVRNDSVIVASFKPQNNKKLVSHFEDVDFSQFEYVPKQGNFNNVLFKIPYFGKGGMEIEE